MTETSSSARTAADGIELTVLMLCRNKAQMLATCTDRAHRFLARAGVVGEVPIADNGSTDSSQQITLAHGAKVVEVPSRGYGGALIGGTEAARGCCVIMGDAEDSCDFTRLDGLFECLRAGDDLVMGNRFRGGIAVGAMPALHRYMGAPLLTGIGRIFFRSPLKEFRCGLHGYDREAMLDLELKTTGMELASEMVVKSTLASLRVSEVPTTLARGGRSRLPHLRSRRDGWRHLRFLLVFSPRWLFLLPGLTALGIVVIGSLLLIGPAQVGGIGLDVASQVCMAALAVIGYQAILFAILTKLHAERGLPSASQSEFRVVRRARDARTLLAPGVALIVVGLAILIVQIVVWGQFGFGALDAQAMISVAIPASLSLILGAQTVMAGMFTGILTIPTRS